MGTRADFYVGRGKDAEWLGSIPFDGYPGGPPSQVIDANEQGDYRARVAALLADKRERGTTPDQGWPWPWTDSGTTNYAYAFDGGAVHCSSFGSEWYDPKLERDNPSEFERPEAETAVFPDMADRMVVTFGPRSGLIVMSIRSVTG